MGKHIVCYSGGHSSAKVAIAVVKRYGKENVVLLNHNINPSREHFDVKRFKIEVAAYLDLPITYANFGGIEDETQLPDQFDISIRNPSGGYGFKQPGTGTAFCTHYLKTEPFYKFLEANYPPGSTTIYYGFDDDEQHRIARRTDELSRKRGYAVGFPLAEWPDTLESTEEIGIAPPLTYAHYKHGNCAGCLKGGMQHWYVTFCHERESWDKAVATEAIIGKYSILKKIVKGITYPLYLRDLAAVFGRMRCDGIPSSEHYDPAAFQNHLKFYQLPLVAGMKPCECSF